MSRIRKSYAFRSFSDSSGQGPEGFLTGRKSFIDYYDISSRELVEGYLERKREGKPAFRDYFSQEEVLKAVAQTIVPDFDSPGSGFESGKQLRVGLLPDFEMEARGRLPLYLVWLMLVPRTDPLVNSRLVFSPSIANDESLKRQAQLNQVRNYFSVSGESKFNYDEDQLLKCSLAYQKELDFVHTSYVFLDQELIANNFLYHQLEENGFTPDFNLFAVQEDDFSDRSVYLFTSLFSGDHQTDLVKEFGMSENGAWREEYKDMAEDALFDLAAEEFMKRTEARGYKEGLAKGEKIGSIIAYCKLISDDDITTYKAADHVGISEREMRRYFEMYKDGRLRSYFEK